MAMPRHPEQNDDPPVEKTPSWQTKVLIAMIAALLITLIALHLAGVFGP
jgi:cytochrome b561